MELSKIRNFCIISHVDHGKSTLADRFLELTETVSKDDIGQQFLDSMDLEKEKGITIKMHPCRMRYHFEGENYQLNLIDTPGHIDFSYETSRSLACVEGVILLVDANKGIQAQTLHNLEQAKAEGLKIIGVVNKIDLPQARVEETKEELSRVLGQEPEDIFAISAKTGEGVDKLLESIIHEISPPKGKKGDSPNALIFDSLYDSYSGVIAYVRVFEGEILEGEDIYLVASETYGKAKEVGYFSPELVPTGNLSEGEIGYIKTGIKEPSNIRIGDTITSASSPESGELIPLPGYKEPQPVLFLSIYPENTNDFDDLKQGLEKLYLSDSSLSFHNESSPALGRGFRIGFLGSLQAEITLRRLSQEFDLEVISTSPQVVFKIVIDEGRGVEVSSPNEWPNSSRIEKTLEPWTALEIITPNDYFNQVFKVLKKHGAKIGNTESLSSDKSLLEADAPLRKVIGGEFYETLKSATKGYASFSFYVTGFRESDLVKMDMLIAGNKEETLSRIVSREEAESEGRKLAKKLREVLPPQQFPVAIQAAVGGKIIARETIKALRKDVTGSLYGGDVTRKKKLLEAQKKGKKNLKRKGRIKIPPHVFVEILRS